MFLSFASPHLGTFYHANPVLNSIMWLARKWTKSRCLEELKMVDALNPRDTFMYKLSQEPGTLHRCALACRNGELKCFLGLEWFQYIKLIASPQDRYVPFASALIELSSEAMEDRKLGMGQQ
jgi:hypothetical protein